MRILGIHINDIKWMLRVILAVAIGTFIGTFGAMKASGEEPLMDVDAIQVVEEMIVSPTEDQLKPNVLERIWLGVKLTAKVIRIAGETIIITAVAAPVAVGMGVYSIIQPAGSHPPIELCEIDPRSIYKNCAEKRHGRAYNGGE